MSPPILLRAFGADAYHSVGKALVIRKAPVSDWRAHRDRILAAMSAGRRKLTQDLVDQFTYDGTVILDSLVLPEGEGAVEKRLRLRHENLKAGDRYEVVTIHRHRYTGVWFRTTVPHVNGTGERCHSAFPIISGHLGDPQRGQQMLRRLSAFCNMDIQVDDLAMFRQYRALGLGVFHQIEEEMFHERCEALEYALRPADVKAADELITHTQQLAGYEQPLGHQPVTFHTPERVAEAETETYVLSTTEELAEAQEQASAFEAAMAKLREEQEAKQGRELVGATAERPQLTAKMARAAEITRAAVERAQQPPAPLVLPPRGADTVVLPPRDGAPAPKLTPLPGQPVWMSLPKRR